MSYTVAVTGIGLATPLALGREKTWNGLLSGYSAVTPDFQFPGILSARVQHMYIPDQTRLLSLAFLAAAEAIQDSIPENTPAHFERFGCTVSVSKPNLNASGTGYLEDRKSVVGDILTLQSV
jgi:3-oxoacyl-(acyl-carrier-protein) synthase